MVRIWLNLFSYSVNLFLLCQIQDLMTREHEKVTNGPHGAVKYK